MVNVFADVVTQCVTDDLIDYRACPASDLSCVREHIRGLAGS